MDRTTFVGVTGVRLAASSAATRTVSVMARDDEQHDDPPFDWSPRMGPPPLDPEEIEWLYSPSEPIDVDALPTFPIVD